MTVAERTEEIYTAYRPKVLQYARSKLGGRADAEDVASEIMLKVLQALPRYDERKASLSTWIYTIARNCVYDYLRAKRLDAVPLGDDVELFAIREFDDRAPILESLNQALDLLPERQHDIVMLHYYYNMPHKEIAERMKLSYTNVRQLCFVAVGALRKSMADISR